MKSRSGRLGIAVCAVLVVACGDAAVGSMMEDGGGVLDDLGSALVDMGTSLMDGATGLRDAGREFDSGAQAQGPGPWFTVDCNPARVATSTSSYTLVNTTYRAEFTADVDALIEVEVCYSAPANDTNNDGCADTQPDGTTCSSTEQTPLTCSRSASVSRVASSLTQVHVNCGYTYEYIGIAVSNSGSVATSVRYRIR